MNCLRSLGFIIKLNKKYKTHGLSTVLIHPPEWEFEKNRENILHFLKKLNVKFPLIVDENRRIIEKLRVNFWPAQILVKKDKILYKHIGEGNYKILENEIQNILKIKAAKIINKEPEYSKFPTIYLGKRKNGKISLLKNKLRFGVVYKSGKWSQKNEFLQHIGKEGYITILTKGRIVNFVAKSAKNKPIKVNVKLNNKQAKSLTINKPQLYKIINLKNNIPKKLALTAKSDLMVYSFSFR